jgi:pyrroline-5-carboxylate reductase
MIRGWLSRGITTPADVMVCDVHQPSLGRFKGHGVQTSGNNNDGASFADVIVLAVKPKHVSSVLAQMSPLVDRSKLVVSIAAGVTSSTIEKVVCR